MKAMQMIGGYWGKGLGLVKTLAAVVAIGFVTLTGINFSHQRAAVSAPAVVASARLHAVALAPSVASELTAAGIEAAKQAMDSQVMRVLAAGFTPETASAQYSIVAADSNGNITFSPGSLVTPIVTGVIACVISAASLVLLWIGVRWLYKVLHGSK